MSYGRNYAFSPYTNNYNSPYGRRNYFSRSSFTPSGGGRFGRNYSGKRRSSCKTITKNGVTYVTGWKIGRKL